MRVSGNRSTRSWQDLCYNFTNRVSDCSVYTGMGKHTQIYKTALHVILVCVFTSLDNSSYTTLISFIAAPLEIAQSGTVLSSLLRGQVFFQPSSSLLWPLKIMGLTITLLSQHVDACHLIEWQGNVISVTPCAGSLVLIAVSSVFPVLSLMLYLPELVLLHLCPLSALHLCLNVSPVLEYSVSVFFLHLLHVHLTHFFQLLAVPCEPSSLCGHFFPR